MASLRITEARDQLAELGNRVAYGGERIIVERRGRDLFALVPVEDVELLEQLEDRIDLAQIRRALAEPREDWESVKKKLRL